MKKIEIKHKELTLKDDQIIDFFEKEVEMKICLLSSFLEKKLLTRQQFVDIYNAKTEYSFVAFGN